MTTIREITGKDGDVWSLEDSGGYLFIQHCHHEGGPLSSMPIDVIALELFAVAARHRTPIHARGQAVIPNVIKLVPSAARSATI